MHENFEKVFEPLTDTIENTSENLTKTITETRINNTKALENFHEKVLELLNDKGVLAPFLSSSFVNLLKPENKNEFNSIKEYNNSNRTKDCLINTIMPVTLYSNMLTFRDTNKSFKLDGDLLKPMTNNDFKVDQSNPQDRNIIYEFGQEPKFNIRQRGRKSPRDKSVIRLLKSPAIMASGFPTVILLENSNELCDGINIFLQ